MGVQAGAIPATGTTTISGLDGRPSLILFLGTNQTLYETPATVTQGGGFLGFAMEDDTDFLHNYCEFAILTTQRCSNLTQTCCHAQSQAGTSTAHLLYEGSVTAINDDGFTITFTTGSGAHQVHYLAIWDIQPGTLVPWEENCNGTPYEVDTGLDAPSFFVALSQWRNTCLVYPKSTSTSLWNGAVFGDLTEPTSMGSVAAQSVINGQFSSFVETSGGAETTLGGVADPFVFGSICTGVAGIRRVNPSSIRFTLTGCGDGVDWVTGQFSQCLIGDIVRVSAGGGTIGSEVAVTYPRVDEPEAVIFCNFQSTTNGAGLNSAKRWGFGFATPDYQCGFSLHEGDGSFYQSEVNPWIPHTAPAGVSAGEVNFTPVAGDIGLVVNENGAGNGASGVMGIKTSCPSGNPLLVSFDGFFQNRPSGTQITTRGGVFIDGEGEPVTV